MHHTLRKVLANKYLVISAAALLLYTFVGFVVAPWLLRWYVPKYAQQNLHCQAGVGKIRLNPFLLTLEIDSFFLKQADGLPLVAFEKFFVDLEMSSLFHWAVVLRELDLVKPDIRVVVAPDGSTNFEKLVTTPSQPPASPQSETKPLRFILQSTTVQAGRIAVVDNRQHLPAGFTVQGFDLHLQDLSTLKDHQGTYHLAAMTDDGGTVQWDGALALSPLRSTGTLSLNTLQISSLWKFFRDSTNLEPPAGQINLSTQYHLNAENTPVQMTLDELRLSTADLSLKLLNTNKAFFHLKKLDLEAPHFDLTSKELRVKSLLLEEGAVDARLNETGGLNLQQILHAPVPEKHRNLQVPPPVAPSAGPAGGADQKIASPPPPAAEPPFKVQADAIEIKNMAIDLDDKSRITPIKAAIAGAALHLQANLEWGAQKNTLVLQEIASELKGISIYSSKSPEPLFATDTLTVAGGKCDLGAHAISVARIALHKGHLDAGLDAQGKSNWQQLLQSKGAGANSMAKPASAPVLAWKFLIKSFEIEDFSSKFSDLTTTSAQPVFGLQGLRAKLSEVDGASPMGFTLDFQGSQGGAATVSGTVNPSLPSVEADIKMAGMVLTSLQPYMEPFVTLELQSASASAHGHLRYGIPGMAPKAAYEGDFSLNTLRLADSVAKKPYLSWEAVQLSQCKLTLQPNSLETQEIKISKPVGELIIGEDKTLNFARVMKKKPVDKQTPPSARPAPKKAEPQKEQTAFPYQISKVRVDKGDLVFADLSLQPKFMTRIHDLKGTVMGLSSVPETQAQVQMDGHVDQYGIAKISGVIRPSDFGRSSHIEMIFRNLEMKNLSPYSGKFAGRLIKTGKVSADLKYKIQDYKMTGDNKVVIDNLVLGDRVDEPHATNLPLDLAIALLKDGSGRIDIGLPVTGDLNDPQFSIGSLIWKMMTNLITKTTTAPFRALGNLFGGESEHFDALEFDPGSSELLPPEKEKILKLAVALKSRPQLKLVIQGRYSPEVDGLELKERGIRAMVATRRGADLKPNDTPEMLDFTDSTTQDTLEKLYKERLGKESLNELEKGVAAGTVQPRTAQHQEKKTKKAGMLTKMVDDLQLYKIIPGGKSSEQAALWAQELYNRLVENEKVADTALQQLAEHRAQVIATTLENEAQIPKDRVSIKAPEPLSGTAPPSATLSLDAL